MLARHGSSPWASPSRPPGSALGRLAARRRAEAWPAGVRSWSDAIGRARRPSGPRSSAAAELDGREEARRLGAASTPSPRAEAELADNRAPGVERGRGRTPRQARLAAAREAAEAERTRVAGPEAADRRARAEAAAPERRRARRPRALGRRLTRRVRGAIVEAEIEAGADSAAQAGRAADHGRRRREPARGAKRVMGIAVGRFSGHYLTERLLPLRAGAAGRRRRGHGRPRRGQPARDRGVAGVKLALAERARRGPPGGPGRRRARGGPRGLARLRREPRPGADPGGVTRSRPRDRRHPRPRARSTSAAAPSRPWRSRPRTRRSSSWSAGSTTAPATPRTSGSTPSRPPSCAG